MYEEGDDNSNNEISAKEILLSLPGVTSNNSKNITNKVENIAQLSELEETDLINMIGSVNGKKLYNFFNHSVL